MEAAIAVLPCERDAQVTIKIDEGCGVLKEKLKRLLADDSVVSSPSVAGIYDKATVNTRQSDYKRLPENTEEFITFVKKV
ncbi:hypothetical protein F442_10462 [Phytophthora nicotianae P10297]|uniref:Uncharacterized protein n=1 Tax=Phytophthora nicotianae P10297 TaxID=1317064 RepID=W2Z5I0_PHYNI|nr:hypothetical protein F442_10462 [Phytophthora nicotianae P10297]